MAKEIPYYSGEIICIGISRSSRCIWTCGLIMAAWKLRRCFCGRKELKEVMNPSNEVKEDFTEAKVKIILASEWIINF